MKFAKLKRSRNLVDLQYVVCRMNFHPQNGIRFLWYFYYFIPCLYFISQEGCVSMWGQNLKIQRSLKTGTDTCKMRDLWVTHFVLLPNVNKVALAFTSKEIGKIQFTCTPIHYHIQVMFKLNCTGTLFIVLSCWEVLNESSNRELPASMDKFDKRH